MKESIEIPDFDVMAELIEKIHELATQKMLLDVYLKNSEAEIVKKATSVEGKPPSMEYIKNSLMVTGFDGELLSTRRKLAEVTADLEKARNSLQLARDILDAWRTKQANERNATL